MEQKIDLISAVTLSEYQGLHWSGALSNLPVSDPMNKESHMDEDGT